MGTKGADCLLSGKSAVSGQKKLQLICAAALEEYICKIWFPVKSKAKSVLAYEASKAFLGIILF